MPFRLSASSWEQWKRWDYQSNKKIMSGICSFRALYGHWGNHNLWHNLDHVEACNNNFLISRDWSKHNFENEWFIVGFLSAFPLLVGNERKKKRNPTKNTWPCSVAHLYTGRLWLFQRNEERILLGNRTLRSCCSKILIIVFFSVKNVLKWD